MSLVDLVRIGDFFLSCALCFSAMLLFLNKLLHVQTHKGNASSNINLTYQLYNRFEIKKSKPIYVQSKTHIVILNSLKTKPVLDSVV